jgi:hypothetical protein
VACLQQAHGDTVSDDTCSGGDKDRSEIGIKGEVTEAWHYVGHLLACFLEETHGISCFALFQ